MPMKKTAAVLYTAVTSLYLTAFASAQNAGAPQQPADAIINGVDIEQCQYATHDRQMCIDYANSLPHVESTQDRANPQHPEEKDTIINGMNIEQCQHATHDRQMCIDYANSLPHVESTQGRATLLRLDGADLRIFAIDGYFWAGGEHVFKDKDGKPLNEDGLATVLLEIVKIKMSGSVKRGFRPEDLQSVKKILDAYPKDHSYHLSIDGWTDPDGAIADGYASLEPRLPAKPMPNLHELQKEIRP